MARRLITQQLYDALLAAYKIKPGNHTNAAKVADCDRRMAKRAWEKGWVRAPWAIPIKQVIHEETVEARAVRAEMRTKEYLANEESQEKARKDAVEARAQEGKMVTAARQSAMGLMSFSLKLLRSSSPLVEGLSNALNSAGMLNIPPHRAIMLVEKMSKLTSQSVNVCQEAMRLERLHMGAPEQVISITNMDATSTDDLYAELREIEAVLRRQSGEPAVKLVEEGA